MGRLKAIRQRMRDSTTKVAEVTQLASSRAAEMELNRLIDHHERGLIGDEEFVTRKAQLQRGTGSSS
jgi:hypothetical protein